MTLSSADFFAAAHAAFAGAGDFFGAGTGTYTAPAEDATPVPVRAMRDDGYQVMGDFGRVGVPRVVLHLSLEDVPQPAPRALVLLGSVSYQLDEMIDRIGGSHTVWAVIAVRPEPEPEPEPTP